MALSFIEKVCDLNLEMRYVNGDSSINHFYIGAMEVTQNQWFKIMNTSIYMQKDKENPGACLNSVGSDYPMYYVNWDDANAFCITLSNITGKRYRLPKDSEWEYAARKDGALNDVAWYVDNSDNKIHPCGCKKPNTLGVYDMFGDLWEWCGDWYDRNGILRLIRGGAWNNHAAFCSKANRLLAMAKSRNDYIGFRVVAEV